mmetsp:Transcript_77792/g.154563  ORF Transcript_77792/g.154563 Transcript_77792/m.154563 type:complete len:217 (-) Transcript_77792:60-710(-)
MASRFRCCGLLTTSPRTQRVGTRLRTLRLPRPSTLWASSTARALASPSSRLCAVVSRLSPTCPTRTTSTRASSPTSWASRPSRCSPRLAAVVVAAVHRRRHPAAVAARRDTTPCARRLRAPSTSCALCSSRFRAPRTAAPTRALTATASTRSPSPTRSSRLAVRATLSSSTLRRTRLMWRSSLRSPRSTTLSSCVSILASSLRAQRRARRCASMTS